MSIRQNVTVFLAALVLAMVLVTVAVVRAQEPCSPGTLCSQYAVWHPLYWYFECHLPPCPSEPM
jgi:hypothetical protein